MASFASNVSIPQGNEFFTRFGRFGGSMELLKQLLTDDDRMKAWVESLLVTAPVEHLTVHVSYQLPSYDELNGMAFDWASDLFSDEYTWEEHESIRGQVDCTPGERSFLMKQFTPQEIKEMRGLTILNVIAWAKANNYRVATKEELVAVGIQHPNLQCQFPIAALGSFTLSAGYRHVAVLDGDDAGRNLDGNWFDHEWDADGRFLLVRR